MKIPKEAVEFSPLQVGEGSVEDAAVQPEFVGRVERHVARHLVFALLR